MEEENKYCCELVMFGKQQNMKPEEVEQYCNYKLNYDEMVGFVHDCCDICPSKIGVLDERQ